MNLVKDIHILSLIKKFVRKIALSESSKDRILKCIESEKDSIENSLIQELGKKELDKLKMVDGS